MRVTSHTAVNINGVYIACDRRAAADLDVSGNRAGDSLREQ
jgi:hypothetical protein